MCDYSLHASASRLAQEGDYLAVTKFPGGSRGLASREACEENANRLTLREKWNNFLDRLAGRPVAVRQQQDLVAVCVPPGATLQLPKIPQELMERYDLSPKEKVTFIQLTPEPYHYRDGVRFKNGKVVSLQRLPEGLHLQVVSLGDEDENRDQININDPFILTHA